jgi:uncharacterized protein (DUF2249 family)
MIRPAPAAFEVDLRPILPGDRLDAVVCALRCLGATDSLDIVADADPRALHAWLVDEAPGRFSLNYIENGPQLWRLRIARRPARHVDAVCCGSCGGV